MEASTTLEQLVVEAVDDRADLELNLIQRAVVETVQEDLQLQALLTLPGEGGQIVGILRSKIESENVPTFRKLVQGVLEKGIEEGDF